MDIPRLAKTVSPGTPLDRRTMMKGGAALVGLAAVPFQALLARPASAAFGADYGPLVKSLDATTGLPLLLLPEGFRYRSFGWTGDVMDDGTPTPPAHDGMAVVVATGPRVVLVRNHEVRTLVGATSFASDAVTYDPAAAGGTTNLIFDTRHGRWVKSWASLGGTHTNCAGGSTPWGTWLTCEETLVEPAASNDLTRTHGWVFEVPAHLAAFPLPLRALGRFVHEAAAIDPVTGIVYETEDRGTSGFYRFLPDIPGRLLRGGRLQMLKVKGDPGVDLSEGVAVGTRFRVTWVDIADPERAHSPGTTDTLGVYMQGLEHGGATFRRLEGCWYQAGKIYFSATSGGAAEEGQIWEYDVKREILTLIFESTDEETLDNPDNVTVGPRGGIVLCEDGDRTGQRLLGLTRRGEIFPFAENAVVLDGERNGITGDFRGFEWAGATFSPDGTWLFANIQTPGITFAITGPWNEGAL